MAAERKMESVSQDAHSRYREYERRYQGREDGEDRGFLTQSVGLLAADIYEQSPLDSFNVLAQSMDAERTVGKDTAMMMAEKCHNRSESRRARSEERKHIGFLSKRPRKTVFGSPVKMRGGNVPSIVAASLSP